MPPARTSDSGALRQDAALGEVGEQKMKIDESREWLPCAHCGLNAGVVERLAAVESTREVVAGADLVPRKDNGIDHPTQRDQRLNSWLPHAQRLGLTCASHARALQQVVVHQRATTVESASPTISYHGHHTSGDCSTVPHIRCSTKHASCAPLWAFVPCRLSAKMRQPSARTSLPA